MHDEAKWHCIMNDVADESSAVGPFKRVKVMPVAVGALHLLVHELERRFPVADFAAPANWQAVQSKLVLNQRSFMHRDRSRSLYREVEPGRRYRFELKRVGEECEYLLARPGNEQVRREATTVWIAIRFLYDDVQRLFSVASSRTGRPERQQSVGQTS